MKEALCVRAVVRDAFRTEEGVSIETHNLGAEVTDGLEQVADNEFVRGEARVQPVKRWLALLEEVQEHPAPGHTVDADHLTSHCPVRVLHP